MQLTVYFSGFSFAHRANLLVSVLRLRRGMSFTTITPGLGSVQDPEIVQAVYDLQIARVRISEYNVRFFRANELCQYVDSS